MPVPDYPAFWTQATDLATLEPHDFGNLSVSPEASRSEFHQFSMESQGKGGAEKDRLGGPRF